MILKITSVEVFDKQLFNDVKALSDRLTSLGRRDENGVVGLL